MVGLSIAFLLSLSADAGKFEFPRIVKAEGVEELLEDVVDGPDGEVGGCGDCGDCGPEPGGNGGCGGGCFGGCVGGDPGGSFPLPLSASPSSSPFLESPVDDDFLLKKSSKRSHSTANSKSSKVPQQDSSTKNWGVSVIPCWPDKSQRMRMRGRVRTTSPPRNTLKPLFLIPCFIMNSRSFGCCATSIT